ncbi:MAG: hypothetical protein K2M37_01820 [Muribaculaceae bacterium]|nr:hypothetical protein [Muribaculaceae bacterium]
MAETSEPTDARTHEVKRLLNECHIGEQVIKAFEVDLLAEVQILVFLVYGDTFCLDGRIDRVSDPFDREVFDRAVCEVFAKGGFSAEMLAHPAVRPLIEETFNTLNGAIDTAIKTETPPELTAALQNNAFVFSGFKTYHSLSEVGLALTDADGNVKPFETFRKDV